MVTGLYGCCCHPFKDWVEHDYYNKQKIPIGTIIKIRHTGEFAFVTSLKCSQGFVSINRFPCDCPRCETFEHNMNLIQQKDFTLLDKSEFEKENQLQINFLNNF